MALPGQNPYARQELINQLGTGGKVGKPGRAGAITDLAGDVASSATSFAPKAVPTIAAKSVPGTTVGAGALPKPGISPLGTAAIGIGGEILGNILQTKEQQPIKGGAFADTVDQYGRRGEGSGGGFASSASKWGGRGASIGSMIPGVGTAIGGGIGALAGGIGSLITKNAPTANADFRNEDAAQAIADTYQKELGRSASPEEIANQLKGQGSKPGDRWVGQNGLIGETGSGGVLGQIRDSPEAQAYRARGSQPAPPAGAGAEPVAGANDGTMINRQSLIDKLGGNTGAAGAETGQAPGVGAGAPAAPGSTTGAVPAGWDAAKVAAGHSSPKYAAREPLVALSAQLQGIPDEAGRKAAAQDAITKMIPSLEAAGAKVLEVKNEKALIDANDGKGPLWIDMIKDIEGEAAPQWIEPDAGGVAEAGGQPIDSGGVIANASDAGQSDVIAQIMAELQKIQGGGADRGDILKQLGSSMMAWTNEDIGKPGGIEKQPGMSDQDAVNFYNRYRQKPAATTGGPLTPSPESQQPTGGTQPNGQLAPSPATPAPIPVGTQPSPTGGSPTSGAQSQLSSMFRQTLMNQLGQNPNAISINDPDLAPASQAFRAATERDTGLMRRDAAEAAGAAGLADSGAARARSEKLQQNAAQATAANDAQLIAQKQQQRIDQLESAKAMAMQLGLAEEANALQAQIANQQAGLTTRGQDITMQLGRLDNQTKTDLANLDAQLQREGYSMQERIARMDAELRRYGIDTQGKLGQGQLSLDFLKTQLQNQQFNDQLGFNIGSTAANLNRDYLLAGLGGG